jgi:hypothetical protein
MKGDKGNFGGGGNNLLLFCRGVGYFRGIAAAQQ